jgi:phosphopantetheine--protein transferase-like protein
MKEVAGCGIDIEELIRFKTKLPDIPESSGFNNLIYTPEEIETNRFIRPELTFPLSFCCKEAVFKALGVSWTNSNISWKDIELLFSDKDNLEDYSIRLSGFAEELFNEKMCTGIESKIEFTSDYVMFQVVLLSKQT